MPTVAKREASCERQLRVNRYVQGPGRRQTVNQILTVWQLDLRPDPAINKKVKLKKGNGKADPEKSECFTLSMMQKSCCLKKNCCTK